MVGDEDGAHDDGSVAGADDALTQLLTDACDLPDGVRELAALVTRVGGQQHHGELGTGSGLASSVVVLARLRHALDAALAAHVHAAVGHDVLPMAAATVLERSGHWSGSDTSGLLAAMRFVAVHPCVAPLWQSGQVSTDAVAALARGLRSLTPEQVDDVLAHTLASLPELSVPGVKAVAARAVELLRPHDTDAAEQRDWDDRSLVLTHYGSMTLIHGRLPGVEGEALATALSALAESLRVEGDGLTGAQRRADALITLINRAATTTDLPATSGGLPVATTVTVGLSEAERLTTGDPRPSAVSITDLVAQGRDPATLAGVAGAVTIGDAAARFALCCGEVTPVLVDDRHRRRTTLGRALADTRVVPLAVGRTTRLATPAQRKALALRDQGCALCDRPAAECQTHHVTAWSEGGTTDLSNLILLCWAHHRAVDLNRFTITANHDPTGPPWTITPTPRHRWRKRQ